MFTGHRTASTLRMAGIGALAAVLLASCGDSGEEAAPTADAAGGDVESRHGGTLRILDYLAVSCLAPPVSAYKDSVVTNQLFDRLTYQDPETGEIHPWIATEWEVNDDATEYTFTLREDVTFSDGSPLDAEAVKENYDQLALGEPDLGVAPWNFISNYEQAEVEAPNVISFRFSQPSVGFLQATSTFHSGLVALSTLELPYEERCQGANVVGSGPFVFESERKDRETVLVRREDYAWAPEQLGHDGKAYLEKLVYSIVPEGNVRVGSLLAGQADTARGILPTDEVLVEEADGYHIQTISAGVANQLTVNPDTPNLEDPRVRQALNHATDREEINSALLSTSYELPTSNLGRRNPGHTDLSEQLQYDPDRAAELLDEAGWTLGDDGLREKNGEPLTIPAYISPHHITAEGILQLLADQWKRIGIQLEIHEGDVAVYSQVITDPSVNAFNQTSPTRLDPDALRNSWDSTQGNVVNHTFPELDELVRAQNEATDPAERAAIAAEAQEFIIGNGLSIPLYEDVLVYGNADHVHGVGGEAQGRPVYLTAWIDESAR